MTSAGVSIITESFMQKPDHQHQKQMLREILQLMDLRQGFGLLDPGSFEVSYGFSSGGQPVASGLTRHLAIDSHSRQRCLLPAAIQRWLEASSLAGGIQPL